MLQNFISNHIKVRYFIKHAHLRERMILLNDMVALRYIYRNTPRGGGLGIIKVYYKSDGHNKILRCSIDNETALKLCSVMKEQGITVEMDVHS